MRIFHTADVHLKEEGDERWQALREIVSAAKQASADYLTISGDLFDSDADAQALRIPLRSIFEGAEFETLIIPGNHDSESYAAGLYFGQGVRILNDPDWSKNIIDRDGVRFIGLPFAPMEAHEFHRRLRWLREYIEAGRSSVLLYHGELLDASFDRGDFGLEAGRYMPSRLAFFKELGVDFVLAGHFHVNFDVRRFGGTGFFVYPGSPVSITRREVGRRHAALIETGKDPIPVALNTHHFVAVDIVLNAFSGDDSLEVIKERLQKVDPGAYVLLSVRGTIHGSEEDLVEAIDAEIAEMNGEISEIGFRDLSRVVAHPVYAKFEERLSSLLRDPESGIDEQGAERLRQLVIQAMIEAGI